MRGAADHVRRGTHAGQFPTYGHESAEKLTVSVSHVGGAYPAGKVAVRIDGTTICTIALHTGTGSCTLGNTRLRGTYRFAAHYAGNSD